MTIAGITGQMRTMATLLRHERAPARLAPAWIALLTTAAATLAAMTLTALDAGGQAGLWENAHWTISPLGGLVAVAVAARVAPAGQRTVLWCIAVAFASYSVGQLLWDVQAVAGVYSVPAPSDVFYLGGMLPGIPIVLWTLRHRLARPGAIAVALDGLTLFLALAVLSLAFWTRVAPPSQPSAGILATAYAVGYLATAGAGIICLIATGLRPQLRGAWVALPGLGLLGLAWAWWLAGAMTAEPVPGTAQGYVFSIALLLIAYGAVTWTTDVSEDPGYLARAARLQRAIPVGAVILSVVTAALPHDDGGRPDPVAVATGLVALTVLARQSLIAREHARLFASERASRLRAAVLTDLIEAAAVERARVAAVLSSLEARETPEATAKEICDAVHRLQGVLGCGVLVLGEDGEATQLASAGHARWPDGVRLPVAAARGLRARASRGPWSESADDAGPLLVDRGAEGRTFCVPLTVSSHAFGVLWLTADDGPMLERGLPNAREIAAVATALVRPGLESRRVTDAVRANVASLIEGRRFFPVFQPIVDLTAGLAVGFEALTRFHDGTRPDLRFAEAVRVGLGSELEEACLQASVEAARDLPPGAWLSLNVSARFIAATGTLGTTLRDLDRGVVLEITEHEPVGNYAQLRERISSLGAHIRLAVDDAGAGYSGLRHILELRPHFVKLDIGLVRGIDSDPARQSMAAGMVHFADGTGCSLVAEGIETAEELTTLRGLGVRYGQGYLLGMPGRPGAAPVVRGSDPRPVVA